MSQNDNIISCNLVGGLGNQLFQIFTTIAQGTAQHGTRKVVFPYTDVLTVGTVRQTYWNNMLVSIKFMTTNNAKFGINNNDIMQFKVYSENGFSYQPIPDFGGVNRVILNGYYQSYKYFDSKKETLFSLIRLKKQQDSIKNEYSRFFSTGHHSVSMHFRLGDYKNIQDCHPLMTYEYYENALRYIIEKRSSINVLYFCQPEDNVVVSTIVSRLHNEFPDVVFTKVDDTIEDWKQMLIMSCCRDNIIANSTFSWWGAYFNENIDKIVCYPAVWFGPRLTHNTDDLFPNEWIKIAV